MKVYNLLCLCLSAALVSAADEFLSCKCKDPSKVTVRKEMNDLTDAEWKIYWETIHTAATTIDPNSSLNYTIWEAGQIVHRANIAIHGTAMFGYWHRCFLGWFEQKLQEINPDFAFFYWDTGREAQTWRSSNIWNHLGKNLSSNGTVLDGPLKDSYFTSVNRYLERGPIPLPLRYDSLFYEQLWNSTVTGGHSEYIRLLDRAHGNVHVYVGGLMPSPEVSAIDTAFYAHHANVDYLLMQAEAGWDIMGYDQAHKYTGVYKGVNLTLDTPLPGFKESIGDVLDVIDTCATYQPSLTVRAASWSVTTAPAGENNTMAEQLLDEWATHVFGDDAVSLKQKSQEIQDRLNEKLTNAKAQKWRGDLQIIPSKVKETLPYVGVKRSK